MKRYFEFTGADDDREIPHLHTQRNSSVRRPRKAMLKVLALPDY